MPIIDVEVVTSTAEPNAASKAQLQVLADELGILFDSEPAGTWVRLPSIDPQRSLQIRPTMVTAKPANGMARDGGSFTPFGGGWASPF